MREDCQVTFGESVVGQEQADNKENFQVASVHVPADGEEPTSTILPVRCEPNGEEWIE